MCLDPVWLLASPHPPPSRYTGPPPALHTLKLVPHLPRGPLTPELHRAVPSCTQVSVRLFLTPPITSLLAAFSRHSADHSGVISFVYLCLYKGRTWPLLLTLALQTAPLPSQNLPNAQISPFCSPARRLCLVWAQPRLEFSVPFRPSHGCDSCTQRL